MIEYKRQWEKVPMMMNVWGVMVCRDCTVISKIR